MSNEYATKDLYASAYLLIKGYELIRVKKLPPKSFDRRNQFEFIFESTPTLSNDVSQFFARAVLIEPMEYVSAMKELKTIMYDEGGR